MTRREARTDNAWRSFDLWATYVIPLAIALPALLVWFRGQGTGATGCCGQGAQPAHHVQAEAVTHGSAER